MAIGGRHYYRAEDGATGHLQLLACRIGRDLVRPRLEAVTDERFRASVATGANQHKHSVLHCVVYTDGRGTCRIDGHLLRCRPGDLVLVDPAIPHQFGATSGDPCAYRAITLSLVDDQNRPTDHGWAAWCRALSGQSWSLAEMPHRLQAVDFQTYLERQRSLIDILTHDAGTDWFAAHRCLLDLLALLMGRALISDANPTPPDRLDRARLLIEQSYHRHLPVAELAHRAGLSPGQFHRRFKDRFGISPAAWQLRLRLRAAQTLLVASSLPCKAIAERLGFADTAAFSKAFKKAWGQSPTTWRDRPRT